MPQKATPLVLVGAVLVLLGIAGLAVPVFTTQKTTDVAKIGGLQVQAQEDQNHVIPPMVAGGAVALGVVLLGAGLMRRG